MEQADLGRLQELLDREVRQRFPDAPVEKVQLLQYGDEPEIEPGELLARVVIAAPEGLDASGEDLDISEKRKRKKALAQAWEAFTSAHRDAMRELREEIDRHPGAGVRILEYTMALPGEREEGEPRYFGPHMRLRVGDRGGLQGDGSLTPVMARVGKEDLETLDTLIRAGIAASRAEAVRWALARIRQRPAYEQLRARSREIEEIKSQF